MQKRMKGDLATGKNVDGGTADVTGFFSGTNSVDGNTECL
jgi:hypothetical protein